MFQIKRWITFLKRWMQSSNNNNNSFVNDSLKEMMCWPFMVELFSFDNKTISMGNVCKPTKNSLKIK